MSSFTISSVIVFIFLAISFNTLLDASKNGSSWMKIALAGGGFIIFLALFVLAVWHFYKMNFDKVG